MKKKISLVLLCLLVLSAVSLPALGAENKLSSLLFTPMTMQKGSSKMNELPKLSDGSYGDASAVAFAKSASENFTDNDYIDMYLTKMSVVESVVFGIRNSQIHFDAQRISKVRIDYVDETSGEYKTAFDNYELNYVLNENYTAEAVFETPVTTSRIRIYILESPRTWGNVRIDELYATGQTTEGKMNNGNLLYNPVTINAVSYDETDSGIWRVIHLNDGTIADGLLSSTVPSEEKPCVIEFDFKTQLYSVTGIDMITQYPKSSGVTSAVFKYYEDGEWKTAKSMTFNRTVETAENQWTTANDAFDTAVFEAAAVSSKFRLEITGAQMEWGTFRINELILNGEKYVPENVGTGGIVNTTISGNITASSMTDGDKTTSVTAQAPVFPEKIEIFYDNAIINAASMSISSRDASVKNIDVEYLSAEGWKTLLSGIELQFTGSEALIAFDGKITTSKIRINVNEANGETFTIDEISVFGEKLTPAGNKISALYFTPMTTNVGEQKFNVLNKLGDGAIGTYNAVVLAKQAADSFGCEDYIEIYNTSKSYVNGIYTALTSASDAYNNQRIEKIKVEALSDETGKWETVLDNYDVDYILNTDYEAKIMFPKTVSATRFRVYPLESPRIWNNIRIDELYTFGSTDSNVKVNNGNLLYNPVTITVTSSNTGITEPWEMSLNINNGNIVYTGLSSNLNAAPPTEENPYIIDFDFGSRWFSVEQIEIITQYPAKSGINKGAFEYMSGGKYVTAKEFNFERNVLSDAVNHYSLENDAYDVLKLELPMKSNKFRLKITDAMLEWNTFRINELIFIGNEISAEDAANVGAGALVYTTLKSADSAENIVDSKYDTVFTAENCADAEMIEFAYTDRMLDISKIQIKSENTQKAPQNVSVWVYTAGKWMPAAENLLLEYTENKAEIVPETAVRTNRIRFIINLQSEVVINGINILGTAEYYTRALGTANRAPNALIETNVVSQTPVSYLNDGSDETVFTASELPETGAEITYNMPGYFGLDKVVIKSDEIESFDLLIKNENNEWIIKCGGCINNADGYILPERITANEVKIVITRYSGAVSISETELIGECMGQYPSRVVITDVARTAEAVHVSVELENILTTRCTGAAAAAVYDKTGKRMLGVAMQNAGLEGNETKKITLSLPVGLENDEITVKAFVFADTKSIMPVSAADVN